MRLNKEHKTIDRREELVEEFKGESTVYKKAKIAAETSASMIGQWQEVDENDDDNGFQYY